MAPDEHKRPSRFELVAVLLAGGLHLVVEHWVDIPAVGTWYNIAVSLLFSGYLVWRVIADRRVLKGWGFRIDNVGPAFRLYAPFTALAVVGLVGYGRFFSGTWPLPATFWMVAALYPVWGLAQQFALQNLLANNLRGLVPSALPHALVTALLFSSAHFPNYPLMLLTFGAGFGFTLVYTRRPNLWVLGIMHGILGALAYYVVLGQDPGADLLALLSRSG